MTPPTFRIGDQVEIIGPTITGDDLHTGEKFAINRICGDYTGAGFPWYPASSLRLVDELKIGDWAKVTLEGNQFTGKIGQVSSIGELTIALCDMGCWDRRHLRKLTPDEIKQHMKPIKVVPTTEDNTKRLDTHREEIDAVNERLSAIEKRQSAMCSYNIETEQRLQKLEAFHMGIAKLVVLCPNGKPIGVNERLSAIERRQGVQQNRMDEIDDRCLEVIDANDGILPAWKAEREDIEKRLDFLEAFQKDQAETRSDDMIDITILRRADRTLHVWHSRDPDECLDWAKRVMDEMRVNP